jgi:hypothetical protein
MRSKKLRHNYTVKGSVRVFEREKERERERERESEKKCRETQKKI